MPGEIHKNVDSAESGMMGGSTPQGESQMDNETKLLCHDANTVLSTKASVLFAWMSNCCSYFVKSMCFEHS